MLPLRSLRYQRQASNKRLDIDELVSEVAKEIHHYFNIDAISIVLRSHAK